MTIPRRALLPFAVLLTVAACDAAAPAGPETSADLALAAARAPEAATGEIVVHLRMISPSPQDVRIRLDGSRRAIATLDDDSDPEHENVRGMPSLKPGSYTLRVDPLPAPFLLQSITCSESGPAGYVNTPSIANVGTAGVNASLQAGEVLTCTFTAYEPQVT